MGARPSRSGSCCTGSSSACCACSRHKPEFERQLSIAAPKAGAAGKVWVAMHCPARTCQHPHQPLPTLPLAQQHLVVSPACLTATPLSELCTTAWLSSICFSWPAVAGPAYQPLLGYAGAAGAMSLQLSFEKLAWLPSRSPRNSGDEQVLPFSACGASSVLRLSSTRRQHTRKTIWCTPCQFALLS